MELRLWANVCRGSSMTAFPSRQTEAPLLIRPYLPDMTRSEVFAVMTGGFATIAGSVMGAYIAYGVSVCSICQTVIWQVPW